MILAKNGRSNLIQPFSKIFVQKILKWRGIIISFRIKWEPEETKGGYVRSFLIFEPIPNPKSLPWILNFRKRPVEKTASFADPTIFCLP